MASVTYAELVRGNAHFRRLWFGQVVSELGNWFNLIAELGLARALSGTALSASLIIAAHLIPFCVVGPFAGAIADRFPRRTMMLVADVARALIALGFLLVTSADRLWIAYVCAAGLSLFTAVFEAAKNASMPRLAEGAQLLPANALMHATRFLQMALGSMLGGVASQYLGYRAAFAINAVSFVVSANFVFRIPASALNSEIRHKAATSLRAIREDLAVALSFMKSSTIVRAIVGLNLFWALGGGMSQVIMDRFGGIVFAPKGSSGDSGVAVLYAATGMGLMTGMVFARRAGVWAGSRDRVGQYIGWTVLGSGACAAACGLMPGLLSMAVLVFVSRVMLSAGYAVQDTLLMVTLPDDLRGKVYTIDRSIELAIMALAALVAGQLFAVLPPRAVVVISGTLMGLPAAVWLVAVARGRLRPSGTGFVS